MPSYDYRCNNCSKRSAIYQTYEEYGDSKVKCPHCGSEDLHRVIGRIRIAKSEDSRLEDLSDPSSWGDFGF